MTSETSLSVFLAAFEAGTLPSAEWTHAAHLAMAAAFLLDDTHPDPVDRIRIGIRVYNEASGGKNTEDSGYHETLTLFWIERIREALSEVPAGWSAFQKVRNVTERYARQSGLFREYYSFDVVRSREARRQWVAPDRAVAHLVY